MIGVIGGTGITGSQVVASLNSRGADFKCIVREPAAAKAKQKRYEAAAEQYFDDTSAARSALS